MKKLLLVFSIIATFGIVVTASTITYSESTSEASSSIDFDDDKNKTETESTKCSQKACCSNKKKTCSGEQH